MNTRQKYGKTVGSVDWNRNGLETTQVESFSKAAYTLANIVFANMFGKFILPRTSDKPGENGESAAP